MKLNDFLDKTEDRIDYLFKRGKNADERCYDFFIRTMTFLILALIILCYGSFVHADTTTISLGDSGNYTEVFDSSGLSEWLSGQGYTTSDFSTVGIASGVQSYPFSVDDLTNLAIPDSVVFNEKTYTPEEYHIFLTVGSVSDHGISYLTCYVIVGENLVVGDGGLTIYDFDKSGIGVFAVAINPHNLSQMWDGNPHYSQTYQGINSGANGFDSSIQYNYFSIPSPVYYCNCEFYTVKIDDSIDVNVRSNFTYQYYHYKDNIFMINYLYDSYNPKEPEGPITESNLNNLALNNYDIYLSGAEGSIDITQSNVLFSVDCNDWILKHSQDYTLSVTYGFVFKLDIDGNVTEYGGQFQQELPIDTFKEGFSVNVGELMYRTKFKGIDMRTGYEFLRDNYNLYVKSKPKENQTVHINGVKEDLDMLDKFVWQALVTGFDVEVGDNSEHTVVVKDARLVTTTLLKSINNGVASSGAYVKTFDFLRGTSFVSNSGILVNHNPYDGYEGETNSGSSTVTDGNGNVTQNNNQTVNVNVNNNISDLVNGTDGESNDKALDFLEAIQNVKEAFASVSNESEDQMGFVQFLGHSLHELPCIDYIVWSVTIIFGLLIVVFIIKAIFL